MVGLLPLGRGVQSGGCPDEVIGDQPGERIAHIMLDPLSLAGNFGLASQWRKLAGDFTDEVFEPLQVGLHGLQLAH